MRYDRGEPVVGRREIKREENGIATAMEDDDVVKLDNSGAHRTSLLARETSHARIIS